MKRADMKGKNKIGDVHEEEDEHIAAKDGVSIEEYNGPGNLVDLGNSNESLVQLE